MMHSFEAKNGAFFHFNADMSGDVGITTRSGREIYIAGADLIEFHRHVESLKRKGDTVYNGDSEFRLVGQSSTMSPGDGVIGTATCELPCGRSCSANHDRRNAYPIHRPEGQDRSRRHDPPRLLQLRIGVEMIRSVIRETNEASDVAL
jgi:hypothetical protein